MVTDMIVKNGKVYSKLGNRVYGMSYWYCEKCNKYTNPTKASIKEDKEWFYCPICKTPLRCSHIEFDKEFKDKKDLGAWIKQYRSTK